MLQRKTLRIFASLITFEKKCERIINHLCSSFWNPNILLVPSIFNVRSNTVTVVTRLFLFIQTWPGYSYMTDIRYSQEVDTNTVFYAKITLFLPQLPPTYPLLVRLILKTTCKVWQWPVFIYSQSTWWKLKLLLTSLMLVIVSIVITVEGEVGQVTYRQYNHCVLLGIE